MVTSCFGGVDKRRILPLTTLVFSHTTKDFKNLNSTTFDFLDNLFEYIGKKGIWLFARGFSNKRLFQKLLSLDVQFIVRLQKKRTLLINGEIKQLQSILLPLPEIKENIRADLCILNRYRWTVKKDDFYSKSVKQELGIETVMGRTLRRINKLIQNRLIPVFLAKMCAVK